MEGLWQVCFRLDHWQNFIFEILNFIFEILNFIFEISIQRFLINGFASSIYFNSKPRYEIAVSKADASGIPVALT